MSKAPSNSENPTAQPDGAKSANAVTSLKITPDWKSWHEARRLVADEKLRLGLLIEVVSKDPVLALEILKTANVLYMSGGNVITTIKTAVTRLGSDTLLEALDKMKEERKVIDDPRIVSALDQHRARANKISFAAKTLADTIAKSLSEDCQSCGLLMTMGELLAVTHLANIYVELAKDLARSSLNYKLSQDHKFDVDKMCLAYLRKGGIPEALIFALDRDSRPPSPARAIMKPICFGAAELVDAFEASRWDKYAPGKSIQPKSSLRLLQISDSQYAKVYEIVGEFLGRSGNPAAAAAHEADTAVS